MKTPSGPTTILCLCFLFLSLTAVPGRAQTYTILHTFGTNVMGVHPRAPLVQGPDGSLYGATAEGGISDRGQVFRVNPDGSGYTALKDFTGANGAQPEAGLVLSGTTLYGNTVGGGTNDNGTVFKVNTDGTGFTVLKEFSESADGANPYGTLVLSGSTLYGTTQNGGDFGFGTVFKVDVNGTGFAVLKHFNWYDGGNPHGALVLSGTTLYGTTVYGNSSGNGTIFSLNTDGSGFTVIKEFDGSVDGSMPYAGVCLSEGVLYGTTQWGGGDGNGTIFRLNTDGTEFTVLKEFNYGESASAQGELVISGMTLYGTGGAGGAALGGTVFRINTNGSDFTVLKDFTDPAEGTHPFGGLLLAGSTLYATAADGGACNFGTVFKIESDGSAFTVLTNFVGGDGAIPMGLAFSGTALYGTTDSGGSSGKGTIYKMNLDGSAYAILQEFGGVEDANPTVELADAILFGTSVYGGANGYGTVFRMNIDGSGFTVLKDFWGSDGAWSYGGVVGSGSALYGTTLRGGSNNLGLVFTINTNGSDFVVLKDFAGSDGDSPMARLVLSGTTLYGTTQGGGDGFGTVFRINTDGNGFMVLKRFTGLDGAGPLAGLVLSNSTLYGTTAFGGSSGNGTVFKINTDGSGFLVVKYFNHNDGANPRSRLVLSGSTLYGSTAGGGIFGQGTLFQIGTDGTDFAVLKHFAGSDGAGPQTGLVLSGTTLVGTTTEGGQLYAGVLFSLSPGLPVIALQPQSKTVSADDNVDLRVEATGWPTPSFQWLRDGAVLDDGGNISGARSAILTISNALGGDGGRQYSVIVSNNYGSVTSLVATLSVEGDPFITAQPPSPTVSPGQAVLLSVGAGGTAPWSYQWFKNGVRMTDGANASGAQASTLILTNLSSGDAAGYCVVVTNSYGSVTSRVAILYGLNVNPPGYSVLHSFTGVGGADPWGPALGGNMLYGTTYYGGDTNLGTVYRVKTDGSDFSALHSFDGVDGAWPRAGLVLAGGSVFGTTSAGGPSYGNASNGKGVVFKMNVDGSGFTVLTSFSGYDDGNQPESGLLLDGATLYGTTVFGGNSVWRQGTVFKVNTDGSGFTVLHHFDAMDGAFPRGGLVLSGGMLYGTAPCDGIIATNGVSSYGSGLLFTLSTNGTDFTVVKRFGGFDGSQPVGNLIISGNTLYGTTTAGGAWGGGSVFKLNTDGSGFAVLKHFSTGDGEGPQGGLLLVDGTLYGATYNGGVGTLSGGTLFKVNSDGSGFAVLRNFDGNPGPTPGMVLSGTNLLGTVFSGGVSNRGVLYAMALPVTPTMLAQPASQTMEQGGMIKFSTSASGYPPPTYQWLFNGSVLTACTNPSLLVSDVQMLHAGIYSVVASNLAGAITSSPARFQVIPAVERRPVPGINLMGEAGSLLTLDYANELTSLPNWLPLASISLTSTSELYLDLTTPLPAQRFYRAWQTGTPSVAPSLRFPLMIPALTLTGSPGDSIRVDGINQFGPTDAWFTLDTVTLTDTSQLYFDVTAPGQPARLYRLMPVP